jgi:hypothetical protein
MGMVELSLAIRIGICVPPAPAPCNSARSGEPG